MQQINTVSAQMEVISRHVPALSELPSLLQNINRSMDQGNRSMDQGNRMNIALMVGLMIIVVVALLRERNFEMSHDRIKVGQVQEVVK